MTAPDGARPSTQASDLVPSVLRRPERAPGLDLRTWDLLVRQARRAGLLARLCLRLEENGLLDSVPERPRLHLEGARTLAAKQARDTRWEVACIHRALAEIDTPVLLLKGAAYAMARLPAARGRTYTDIDVMVPKDRIGLVEETLQRHGWVPADLDTYDQHYYRDWTHQIPPMHNLQRGSVIDVHHTIVPLTARVKPDAQSLLDAARPVTGLGGLRVLAPPDMVLHSAVHLFNEGEFDRGLRDLSDLDELLRHFGSDSAFWPTLVTRARDLDLSRVLYYALRYTVAVLATPVPADAIRAAAAGQPGSATRALMDAFFLRALRPTHQTARDPLTGLALWLLFVRSHYLRMPLHILVPHLVRKAVRRRTATGDRP